MSLELTPRERDIMRLVAEGHSNKVVADKAGIATSTVKAHLHQIMTKMQVSNRTQLARAVLERADA